MKKLMYLSILFFALTSCKKSGSDETTPTEPSGNNNGSVSTVPASFTQKVLLEFFTSANFGVCPSGMVKADQAVNSNSARVYSTYIHDADGMTLPQINTYISTYGVSSYPSGMVNRIPSLGNVMLQPSQFLSNVNAALAKTAKCGLAINSTVSGSSASVEVHAGFKEPLSGNYGLVVYLTEEEVTGTGSQYDQKNNDNMVATSPYYNQGNPIVGFKHNNTVRKIISATEGDAISASSIVAGGEFKKTYSVSLSGYNQNKLSVIACILKKGTSATTYEVMNVQKVSVGSLKNWD